MKIQKIFFNFFAFFLILSSSSLILSMEIEQTSIEEKLDKCVSAYVDLKLFNGVVLVTKDEKILLHKAYGFDDLEIKNQELTLDSKFRIGSISKQFTAAAILQLAEQGKIDLNTDITTYLTDFPITGVTVNELLTHTGGLEYYFDRNTESRQVITLKDVDQRIYAKIRENGLKKKSFEYTATVYVLLGRIVSKVAKQPLEEYFQKNIFDPLKMTNTGCACPSCYSNINGSIANGHEFTKSEFKKTPILDALSVVGTASLYTTAADLYKWDRALYKKDANIFKKQETFEEFFKGRVKAIPPQNYLTNDSEYAYGWVISPNVHSKKCFSHFGKVTGFRGGIFRYEDENACIIILSNLVSSQIQELHNQLSGLLFNKSYKFIEPKTVEYGKIDVPEKILCKYIGEYKQQIDESLGKKALLMKINLNNGIIYATITSSKKLIPINNNEFQMEGVGINLRFDENGSNVTTTRGTTKTNWIKQIN